MDKIETLMLVLRQLIENHKSRPEYFKISTDYSTIHASSSPTIVWKRVIDLDEDTRIDDPNSDDKYIVVTYDKNAKVIRCSIYPNSKDRAEAVFSAPVGDIPILNGHYRYFMRLFKAVQRHEKIQEQTHFIKKFHYLFPGSFEDDIFGK
jgi:hypothetical protein